MSGAVSECFALERQQDLWTVRFRPLNDLMFMREDVTEAAFELLAELEAKRVKVLRIDYPAGNLSPDVVDQFLQEASQAPPVSGSLQEPPLPTIVRRVSAAIPRLLASIRKLSTFLVVSFQGEIDLDLLGVLLVANYRICSEDTVIVNRVLDREFEPGSGVLWLLTRYLGYAMANHLIIEGQSLTAQEAMDMRLIDRVVSGDGLESESQLVAERFAAKPAATLASLVRASLHLEDHLESYLEKTGTGFGG